MGGKGEEPRVTGGLRAGIDLGGLAETLKPLAYGKRLELLRYLTEPHYLEEIASHLKMARPAAKKHVDQLLEIGVIEKQQGERDSGPVVEYVVVRPRLFALSEEFSKLGALQPKEQDEALERTQQTAGPAGKHPGSSGPGLSVAHGLDQGRFFPLRAPGPWEIGRDADTDICLDYDPFASNRHAEIRFEDGRYVIADMYSTNGTFLDWEKMDRGAKAELVPGTLVGVGKTVLVFQG